MPYIPIRSAPAVSVWCFRGFYLLQMQVETTGLPSLWADEAAMDGISLNILSSMGCRINPQSKRAEEKPAERV